MFSFDVFTEIMIVGGLVLLAMTPLFVRLSSWTEEESGFVHIVDYLKEGTGRLAIALLVTYTVGVASNRLIDDGLDFIKVNPGSECEAPYKDWANNHDPVRPKTLKLAEFWLRERNPATAGWLDTHKSYERILRGAMAACAILIVAMASYRLSNPPTLRYKTVHFAAISVLLLIFSLAFHSEASKYKHRVFDLVTGLPELCPELKILCPHPQNAANPVNAQDCR